MFFFTEKYPSSGQNIALNQSTGSYPDANTSVQEMINLWFSEYKYANMNDIRKFSGTSGIFFLKRKEFGHFTVMVNDKNNATGCAMVRYQKNGFKTNYFVCNYAYTNVVGQQVYESGRAASKCKVRNTVYKGLCKWTKKKLERKKYWLKCCLKTFHTLHSIKFTLK